ncbi:MAG: LysR family transcriptional regulator [Rhizobiaceae bacterium]|nr:LysR family transcriptional regulator [Rhizobiaceae bacterium]
MRELNRVHLNGLRALEAAARLGSLQKAADELGVTPGAVSQHVIRTEEQLGRPVLERTREGFRPTEFGAAILPRLAAGFRELEAAVTTARRQEADILTISVAPVFAAKWLVFRLARFAERRPDIRVRLDATTALVDLDTSDIDLAIRVGPGDWPGVKAEWFMDQEVFPVCAPALAGRLLEPRDLPRVPVVVDAHSSVSWDVWLAQFGMREADLAIGNSFTDAALALDAAIAGQGVFLGWQILAQYPLQAGTLVQPFPQRMKTGAGYYLVTSPHRREDRKVADFKTWLKDEIAETQRMFT